VSVAPNLKTRGGAAVPAVGYSFTVSATDPKQQPAPRLSDLLSALPKPSAASQPQAIPVAIGKPLSVPCDTLPAGFPAITVLHSNDPSTDALFIAPFYGNISDAYLFIVDNRGIPCFCRVIPGGFGRWTSNGRGTDYSLISSGPDKFYAMDSSYTVVDSFATGNGYSTDLHELQLLPSGHALLMSYDHERVDMSAVTPGGNPNANVIGLIIQELDGGQERDIPVAKLGPFRDHGSRFLRHRVDGFRDRLRSRQRHRARP